EEEEKDRLSDLPDAVLQHIMNFMNTRDVVRTCVLSKRWNNLWKHVTTLSFSSLGKVLFYNKFVPKFLANRDASTSLIDLNIEVYGFKAPNLTRIAKYAAQHNAQHLEITTQYNFRGMPTSFFPLMFSCHSLTSLVFGTCVSNPPIKLPKSLFFPTLKTLHLFNVRFDGGIDHHCVEPFSACSVLSTLTLEGYSFCNDADTFCITNSSLSILKIWDNIIFSDDQLSSTCDLPFLEEVNIKILSSPMKYSVVAGWLQYKRVRGERQREHVN
ncbi:hypothetical protein V8G54_004838, partial [Vigna mungo]